MKVARRVLRGPRCSNAPGLPDRDLRPGKIHRKVSGCFRTLAGAERHAHVRSYLSATRKNDIPAITARVLVAFRRDVDGDTAAVAAAAKLAAVGIECLRVELPNGQDVNDLVCAAASPADALATALREAAWITGTATTPPSTRLSAEVLESFTGAQQVPDDLQQAERDSDSCLVGSAAAGDLTVLGSEVAAFGARRRPGTLDESPAQPPVAVGGADPAPLASRLVVPWGQPGP